MASGSPARDIKAAGSGRTTGGAKKATSAGGARAQALANIATRRRVGTGAGAAVRRPDSSAHLGANLPATNAGDNDADDFPTTAPGAPTNGPAMPGAGRVPVSAHSRALPTRKG